MEAGFCFILNLPSHRKDANVKDSNNQHKFNKSNFIAPVTVLIFVTENCGKLNWTGKTERFIAFLQLIELNSEGTSDMAIPM